MGTVTPNVITRSLDVTIAASASLSGVADLGDKRVLAIEIPANTEGSVVTFQASKDGSTFYNVYDLNGEYSLPFTDPCVLIVPPVDFLAHRYLKVRTGTSGSATNQSGADATLTLILG